MAFSVVMSRTQRDTTGRPALIRPPTLTLVVGSEDLLVERAVAGVVAQARTHDRDVERRDVDASVPGAAGEVAQACSPTLFGGGSVVVVAGAESADASCVAELLAAVADPASGLTLVVWHAAGAKGKKTLAALREARPTIIDCPQVKRGRGMSDFVAAEMRSHKRSLTVDAQTMLCLAVGSDIRALAAACAQLVDDVADKQIDVAHVRQYFGGTAEVTGFQIADAVLARKPIDALQLLRLAETSDGSRLGPATISALANATRQLVGYMSAPPGMSERDLAILVRVPPWKLKMLAAQARRWRRADLARAMLLLSDADGAMKGGLREGEQLDAAQKSLALQNTVCRMAGLGTPGN